MVELLLHLQGVDIRALRRSRVAACGRVGRRRRLSLRLSRVRSAAFSRQVEREDGAVDLMEVAERLLTLLRERVQPEAKLIARAALAAGRWLDADWIG